MRRFSPTLNLAALLMALLLVWRAQGQGYLPRPGVILSSSSRPAGVLRLRQLYSQSKRWKSDYKASPKSACSRTGSSASLCAASAGSADASEQILQLIIATSPGSYSARNPSDTVVRLLNPPADQLECNTCTAFAVRAAAEAAVAAVLQVNANKISLSVESLYFCGDTSGPMQECKSGWTLEAALKELTARGHNLPTERCLPYRGVDDPSVLPTRDSLCAPVCSSVSDLASKGRFSYRRITDMWQAQQHIRLYGAVVTRFDVFSDLQPFFDNFGNVDKVYKPGPGASFQIGHAVVLVGYNNDEEYWVVKNSWGPDFADGGFFKVAFNACSVLTEGDIDAYGVVWQPTPPNVQVAGGVLDVWRGPTSRCFWYQAKAGDFLSKISWLGRIPLDQLMLQNTDRVKDLDAPLAGTLLLLCDPAPGRFRVLSGNGPQEASPSPKPVSSPSPSPLPPKPSPLPSPSPKPSPSPPQSSKSMRQLCAWDATDGCYVLTGAAQQAVQEQPVTLLQKFDLFRYNRDTFCSALESEAACTAFSAKRKCYWDGEDVNSPPEKRDTCYSHDYNERRWFLSTGGSVELPENMACPGSKARDFLKCYVISPTSLCEKLPGCGMFGAARSRRCYPNWFYDLPAAQADQFLKDFRELKPEVWGSCEGACIVRQGKICNTTGSSRGACMRHAFCSWEGDTKKCSLSLWDGNDAFSRALSKLADECPELKTQAACEGKQVELFHAGKWLDWVPPAASASTPFACDTY